MSKIKLYRYPLSGHSHRVEVFLSLLGLEAELVDVDLGAGEHKRPEFLTKNPFGQVPVLKDGRVTLWDSNATLVYLANRYDPSRQWLPSDAVAASQVQRFLSVAAGPLAHGPASARLVTVFGAGLDQAKAIETSHALLHVLNDHLSDQPWLVGERPTIADVANYTYIAHAPEGGVSLADHPHVSSWLARFEQLHGFVPINNSGWKTARKKAGLSQVRVHDLKHTFGRRLRAANVPLETRKVLLGHRNGDITTHYSAPELEELIVAVNKVCEEKSGKSPALVILKQKTAGA